MKIAYFDCFSGASGDMILGAMVDAGLDWAQLKNELAKLKLDDYELHKSPTVKCGIGGTKVDVIAGESHSHQHRRLEHIREIVQGSDIPPEIMQQAMDIFTRIAEAEAKVHRKDINEIHFHEVGALDSIIDVVGAVIGLRLLGVEQVYCSRLNLGGGYVKCAHGMMPVPAPATAELVRGAPVYSQEPVGELLTPTGAAILTTLAAGFGPIPDMRSQAVGYGAGQAELAHPNLLRVIIGEIDQTAREHDHGHSHAHNHGSHEHTHHHVHGHDHGRHHDHGHSHGSHGHTHDHGHDHDHGHGHEHGHKHSDD